MKAPRAGGIAPPAAAGAKMGKKRDRVVYVINGCTVHWDNAAHIYIVTRGGRVLSEQRYLADAKKAAQMRHTGA